MRKIVLSVVCLASLSFANELESLKKVNLTEKEGVLTGTMFNTDITINKSKNTTITLEEGFCKDKNFGYRISVKSNVVNYMKVYDSCSEKEENFDSNYVLEQYPIADFSKVVFNNTTPIIVEESDLTDNSDPFANLNNNGNNNNNSNTGNETVNPVNPTEPTEPTTPTDSTDPTDPTEPVDPTDSTEPTTPTTPTEPVVPTVPSVPEPPQYVYDYTPLNFSGTTAKNSIDGKYFFWKQVSAEQYTENMNKILIDSIYKYYEKTKGIDNGRKEAELLFQKFREPYLKGIKYNYSQEEDKIIEEDMVVPKLQKITIYNQEEAKANAGIYNFVNTDVGYGAISFEINEICNGPCSNNEIVTFDNKEAYDSFMTDFYEVRKVPFNDNFEGSPEKINFSGNFCAYFKEGTTKKTKCFTQAALTDAINENFEKYIRSANIPGYGGGLGNFGLSSRTWRFAYSEQFLFRMKKSLNSVARFAPLEKRYEVSYINFYDKSMNNSTYPNGYMKIIYKVKTRSGTTYYSTDSSDSISYNEVDNVENTQAREQLLTLIRSL
ncbi:hypothetical protein [Aliarcobacter butzleri]|uniref:hypothetical protein n=1 Tax=Aliarcobacter butzleri TaxID=28197 RepID=UPI0021B35AE3|nr:hypothetical protein [Aliarcobacter butzleri]MCT7596075.1 hypothetical protein [Aliarcobacter butzleri]